MRLMVTPRSKRVRGVSQIRESHAANTRGVVEFYLRAKVRVQAGLHAAAKKWSWVVRLLFGHIRSRFNADLAYASDNLLELVALISKLHF